MGVAQPVRAPGCGPGGRGFESRHPPQFGPRGVLLVRRSGARASRARREVSRLGRAVQRQLFRRAELRGVLRRLVRLHPEGRALPDGAVDVLPHQRRGHGTVRAHADRRGRRRRTSATSKAARRRSVDTNQLHAAVVELVALEDATIKYSTVQNWYAGDKNGVGGIYNFVTKRGKAFENSKISWTQVETGSAITWKYPSVILQGDNSVGEFYSRGGREQHAAGRHRHEDDPHRHATRSRRSSPRASAPGRQNNSYRGQVQGAAEGGRARATTRSATRCSSAIAAARTRSRTSRWRNNTAIVEHEASDVEDRRGSDLLSEAARSRAPSRRFR